MSASAGPQSTLSPGASSFLERQLTVTFYIQNGTSSNNYTQAKFGGLRISAFVDMPGMNMPASLSAVIYGLPLSFMNQASNMGSNMQAPHHNKIRLTAGDEVNGFSEVYYGTIISAVVDGNGAPDVSLAVQSVSTLELQLMPIPTTSITGSVPAASVFQAIANQLNFTFINNNVTTSLSNPYFHGTAMEQIQECAIAANVEINIQAMMQSVLQITPVGQPNTNGPTPLISASTGMIGYPSYASNGINLRVLYNPAVLFNGKIQVQSIFPQATGVWKVSTLAHTLESKTPDGLWETEIGAFAPWSIPQ